MSVGPVRETVRMLPYTSRARTRKSVVFIGEKGKKEKETHHLYDCASFNDLDEHTCLEAV